jgi:hypothetical protein
MRPSIGDADDWSMNASPGGGSIVETAHFSGYIP